MPLDTWANRLESEAIKIEERILFIGNVCNLNILSEKDNRIAQEMLRELRNQLERKEHELRVHRQRDKELGIKY